MSLGIAPDLRNTVGTYTKLPPAIVLGEGSVTLAAVLRLLHAAGIEAYSACLDRSFCSYSRWFRPLTNSWPGIKPATLADLLERVPFESAVLVPTSDAWLEAVAMLPEELRLRFPSSVPSFPKVESFTNKWCFAKLLRKVRVPHPQTYLLNSIEQMDSFPDAAFENTILKPLRSAQFSEVHGVKGFLVNSRSQALRAMEQSTFPMLLQEFIPGPPTTGYFIEGLIDRQGRTSALFARRRLRMYPSHLGNSTVAVSVPLREVSPALESLQQLLEATAYHGIFSAEFKRDERDGVFKLLEVNARAWWYVEAPARAGMNVCEMAYRDALGLQVDPVTSYASGDQTGILPNDLRAWRHLRRLGGESFWSWLFSWRDITSIPFHWDDPLPAIVFFWQELREFVTRKTRKPVYVPPLVPAHREGKSEASAVLAKF